MRKTPLLSFALSASVLISFPTSGSRAGQSQSVEQAPRKVALLVGAWDYWRPGAGDFVTLKSEGRTPGPLEDVEALRRVLVSRLGFKEEDVKVLTSKAETTRKSIIENFETFLLQQTRPGDFVYFHYSGHGSQLPDRDIFAAGRRLVNKNLLVDEPDGLDETLVPTDYGANGANEIRDDELNALVTRLMERRPAGVILTFDSCHSGTVVRGGQVARGKSWQQRSDWSGPKPRSGPALRGRAGTRDGLLDGLPATAKEYVAISAAQEKERAWQVYDAKKRLEMGRFTDALVTALAETDSRTTYQDLFARINALMASRYSDQHPQFEGQGERRVMDGRVKDRPGHLPVYTNPRGELILEAGMLHGVTEGSVVALYPLEAEDLTGTAPLGTAEVKAVRLSDSTLAVRSWAASARTAPEALSMKAVEVERRYGPERLSLLVEGEGEMAQAATVLRAVRALQYVAADTKAGEPWSLRLRPAEERGSPRGRKVWLLERADGSPVERVADAEGAAEAIVSALKREAKWRHAKSLENRNPLSLVRVKMRIIRVEARGDCESGLTYVRDLPGALNPSKLRIGDSVAVEVMNLGERDAYITLFDLTSEADVVQLWPDPRAPITDNFISAGDSGKWVRLWSEFKSRPALFCITEPDGTDIFKLISTRRRVDFREFRTRASLPPLDAMLRAALYESDAAAAPFNIADDWYTDALTFEVVR